MVVAVSRLCYYSLKEEKQMSITLRDCLKLPSLSLGRVIAGHKGLDSIVTTVSVLEFNDTDELDIMTPNELLISALFTMKDDVEAQCKLLQKSKYNGDVGLVLFYSDVILGHIDDRFTEMADLLNFPIILLPERDMGLKYSDVISDVMEAIFYDRKVNNYFVSSTIERLSQTSEAVRSPSLALQIASDYAKASFFLCDESYHLIASSFWPATNFLDFNRVKETFEEKILTENTVMEDREEGIYFRTPFVGKAGNKLMLCAVTHNDILYSGIMSEVVEVIQLFTALWNYNLNVSAKESVIPALFECNEDLVRHICQFTGIKEELYNEAVIIELLQTAQEREIEVWLTQTRSLFEQFAVPLIADHLGTHIIMLYFNGEGTKDMLLEEELQNQLIGWQAAKFCTTYHSEQLFDKMGAVFKEYAAGKDAAQKIYPNKRQFTEEDMHYARRVQKLFNSIDAEKEYYLNLLTPIMDDREPELMETLACYLLDASSGLKAASALLYVHRNTVLYRLHKIRMLLGYDLAKMPMAYDIYMAVSLHRLRENEKESV